MFKTFHVQKFATIRYVDLKGYQTIRMYMYVHHWYNNEEQLTSIHNVMSEIMGFNFLCTQSQHHKS